MFKAKYSHGILSLALVAALVGAPATARETTLEAKGENQVAATVDLTTQYYRGSNPVSAIVLAENARGEQILLTTSLNMGRFYKSVLGEYYELTDWTSTNSMVHEGVSHTARIPKVINGSLAYSQSVAFYRPRPRFEGNVELPKNLLPATDFGLVLNTGKTDLRLSDFDRLYHDDFVKVVEFADVKAGDSVILAGVSARNFPSYKPTSLGGVVAHSQLIEQVLADQNYDETGRPTKALAFDEAKEIMIVSSQQIKGFSGGSVIDEAGRLVGMITRSGETKSGVYYYRALKMDYITERLIQTQFPDKLRQTIRTIVAPTEQKQLCQELMPVIEQVAQVPPENIENQAANDDEIVQPEVLRPAAMEVVPAGSGQKTNSLGEFLRGLLGLSSK